MRQRVITALVLAPIALAAVLLASPYPIFLLALVLNTIAFGEIRRMLGGERSLPVLTLIGLVLPFYALQSGGGRTPAQLLPYVAALFVLGIVFAALSAKRGRGGSAETDLAGLWAAMPLLCVLLLHRLGQTGGFWHLRNPALMAMVPLWAGDIAGIFAGRAFGKRLLAPKVSPKKTIEGGIANLFACIAVAAGLGVLLRLPLAPSLVCGLAAGTLGQAGDLFESWVKRRAGLKDSGTLLPGHGGIMDRIDSLLFTAPAVTLILYFWAR